MKRAGAQTTMDFFPSALMSKIVEPEGAAGQKKKPSKGKGAGAKKKKKKLKKEVSGTLLSSSVDNEQFLQMLLDPETMKASQSAEFYGSLVNPKSAEHFASGYRYLNSQSHETSLSRQSIKLLHDNRDFFRIDSAGYQMNVAAREPAAHKSYHEMSEVLDRMSGYAKKRKDEEKNARMSVHKSAENMIMKLPLSYLYSKPEMRQYAMQAAVKLLMKPVLLRAKEMKETYFIRWMCAPKQQIRSTLNEKQFGCVVIVKAFQNVLLQNMKDRFRHWGILYASRYEKIRARFYNKYAKKVQEWYRRLIESQKAHKGRFERVVKATLYRRRAIKHFVYFEVVRRQSLEKVRRGIALRRRLFFAARQMQRIWRWVLLKRETTYRLTRQIKRRAMRRWMRQHIKRSRQINDTRKVLFRLGGYTKCFNRLDDDFKEYGLIVGANECARVIQRAWFRSCDRLTAYMLAVAKREKEEYERMRNMMAARIQDNVRAVIWKRLVLAAVCNNRARRIQRAFRSSQYRYWVSLQIKRRHLRLLHRLQKWTTLKMFQIRFARQIVQRQFNKKVQLFKEKRSRKFLQRYWRKYSKYQKERRERARLFYAQQRNNLEIITKSVLTIQRNWIQFKAPHLFGQHVYKLCQRIILERRRHMNLMAFIIQKLAHRYMENSRILRRIKENEKVNIIIRLARVSVS